jgi:hypothetical protein
VVWEDVHFYHESGKNRFFIEGLASWLEGGFVSNESGIVKRKKWPAVFRLA